jgi:hypothetical protein
MQIADLDVVEVNKAQAPDTTASDVERDCRTKPATANNEDRFGAELFLTLHTKCWYKQLSRVA